MKGYSIKEYSFFNWDVQSILTLINEETYLDVLQGTAPKVKEAFLKKSSTIPLSFSLGGYVDFFKLAKDITISI